MAGKRDRPKRSGRDPRANWARDWLIVLVVKVLVADGFRATRNKARAGELPCAEGGSACDAVGAAFNMTYGAIERVGRNTGQARGPSRSGLPRCPSGLPRCPSGPSRCPSGRASVSQTNPRTNKMLRRGHPCHSVGMTGAHTEDRLITRAEVERRTGLGRTALYRMMRAGEVFS